MAEQEQGDQVSRQAFDRVTGERDQLKQQLSEASKAIEDFRFIDRAYSTFKGIDGVTDPFALAQVAVRDVTLKSVPEDQFGEKLTGWYQAQKDIFGGGQSAPKADPTPEPPVEQPRGFASGPQPGGGQPPTADRKIDPRSPEFRNASRAQKEQWDQQGLIDWHPIAQGIQP